MSGPSEPIIERIVRRIEPPSSPGEYREWSLSREWLLTNGLGGYASTTIGGAMTRRYHGLLVAALPNPLGRVTMLNHLTEDLVVEDGRRVRICAPQLADGSLDAEAARALRDFRLEDGLPVWQYQLGDIVLERRVLMPHRQNTVLTVYRLVAGARSVTLELTPAVHFRSYETPVSAAISEPYRLTIADGHYEITSEGSAAARIPPLRLMVHGAAGVFRSDDGVIGDVVYPTEQSRGYDHAGALWSPGSFAFELSAARPVAFIASTEQPEVMAALTPEAALRAELERRRRLLVAAHPELRRGVARELVLAADQFLITPAGRVADTARAWAVGDEIRTVIAGYHWFTDWGRDTMISLEGLTLVTGRHREAGAILRAFAHYVRDGLIPNLFPDGSDQGLYHTADATLWFFHAIERYVAATGNRALLGQLLPTLLDIVEHHRYGTRFGIGMDPADGLLRQGADAYQLTWMDAKVDDWVVTPRRGKAVEINALWYNALCLMEGWVREERGTDASRPIGELAARVRDSFNRRFWYEEGGYLYDVVDGPGGDSTELRPNQILSISLGHPVLDPSRWCQVVQVVQDRLLTHVGLRSLAPGSASYKDKYYGDLRARDAAYHQGTVWAWLIGPWVDAWIKVHPDDRVGARRFLDGLLEHLGDYGVGTIAEIFDAEPPYTPRGCIAQAWSVAEELRCLVKTA